MPRPRGSQAGVRGWRLEEGLDKHLLVLPAQVKDVTGFERAHGGLVHAADDKVGECHSLQVGSLAKQGLLPRGDAGFEALVGGFGSGIPTGHDATRVRQIAGYGRPERNSAPPESRLLDTEDVRA